MLELTRSDFARRRINLNLKFSAFSNRSNPTHRHSNRLQLALRHPHWPFRRYFKNPFNSCPETHLAEADSGTID